MRSILLIIFVIQDIKKVIRDDPRYERYSSSEKKCEKEFYAWIKEKTARARDEYKTLLQVHEFVLSSRDKLRRCEGIAVL